MSTFKHFQETISCQVIPVDNRRVWLDEKVVSADEMYKIVHNRSVEAGQLYYDFPHIKADTVAELSDKMLRELYKRGMTISRYYLLPKDKELVMLDYSFLDDKPWYAQRTVQAVAMGSVTAEGDHRRDPSLRGKWFTYAELVKEVGKNQAHKIFAELHACM